MLLAERFKDLRVKAGLTGTALAAPRYTPSYISQIESGRRRPSSEALTFFAGRLGVSPDFLATGVPEGIDAELRYGLERARNVLRDGRASEAEADLRELRQEAARYELAPLEAQASVALADALSAQGRVREAIDVYEEALEGSLSERERGLAVGAMARAYRSAGDLTYAAEVVESMLSAHGRGPLDPAVATDLHSVLVSVYFERGDVFRAERAAQRALAAADEDTPLEVRAFAYWNASRVLAEGKRWEEALEMATRARVLLEELDDQRRLARLHNAYAFICLETEPPRMEEARRHLDLAETLLTEAAAPEDLAYVDTERSRLALMEGKPADALAHAQRALYRAGTDEMETARCWFLRGRALGALGRRDEASSALHESAAMFGKLGGRQQEAACWREIGELDLAAGDLQAAVEALRAGLEALDPRRSRA